jgi:pimeloyl-ACP methyl ester carboxylesterase
MRHGYAACWRACTCWDDDMSRVLKKTLKIAGITCAAFVCLVFIIAVVNAVLTSVERAKYPAPGKMVEVDGKRMHVYFEGNGKEKIILLSGFGTPSPVVDYLPLIKVLSMDFTVAAVEYYGYGWSDRTNKPRTNQNMIEETRRALMKAGILPPYVLVPHSISGLYALYYANTYPDEVEAIIGLDTSVPEASEFAPKRQSYILPGILRVLGLARIVLLVRPDLVGHDSPDFSDADRRMLRMMVCWNYLNTSQRNEAVHLLDNVRQLEGDRYPKTIPVSLILSKTSIEEIPRVMPGLDWEKAHRDLIARNKDGRIVVLEGDHYIHWGNSRRVAAIIKETIRKKSAAETQ